MALPLFGAATENKGTTKEAYFNIISIKLKNFHLFHFIFEIEFFMCLRRCTQIKYIKLNAIASRL